MSEQMNLGGGFTLPGGLLIPGTSSIRHLRENLKAATLEISHATLADLDQIDPGSKHA